MKSPLVTIVTPSYNQGRFIRATMESVLSQDYPHIEYIIMDGKSTDETERVVREYCGRLTWISEKDRGQSHAINKGFQMARGEIVAWLNSDDTILPGAVSHAVHAFEREPSLGAVYGEGYQIDIDGNIKMRFPATEPFNLWKLVYLSDYILQQTVYFRRSVFEEVGYLDESLHWGMDWDILIRIGKRYMMKYIPEYMGCLREYEAAKTFSGGGKRFRELAQILRRHGKSRYPPGYITYGLDTYGRIWDARFDSWTPKFLKSRSDRVRRYLLGVSRAFIAHTLRDAQGLYSDGWASTRLHYMLPPGNGSLRIQGELPNLSHKLRGQTIRVNCNRGRQEIQVSFGEFDVIVSVPVSEHAAEITLNASRSIIPQEEGLGDDSRRLAFILREMTWA